MTAPDYRIQTIPTGRLPLTETGATAEEHLRSQLETMAATFRLYCDAATPADLERLEVDPERLETKEAPDVAHEVADVLKVRTARWATGDPYESVEDARRPLARVELLLTFGGGPNVVLVVDFDPTGDNAPRRVTLERSWANTRDRAETEDDRALKTAEDAIRAFYVGE